MNVKDYIAVDEDGESLYAAHFEGAEYDALSELLHPEAGKWLNMTWLFDFFDANWKAFKQSRFPYNELIIDPEDAIDKTRIGANYLLERIIEYAETGKQDRTEGLSQLFEPLSLSKSIKVFGQSKYKSTGYPFENSAPWLRIYAIRLHHNLFVITGGGIKMTETMQDCPHLSKELEKLKCCARHLRERGEVDEGEDIFTLY